MDYTNIILNIVKILLFIAGNLYIGIKEWQFIGKYIPFLSRNVYWFLIIIIIVIHGIFRLGTIGIKLFSDNITYILMMIGAYWFAAFQSFVMLFIITDVFNFIIERYSGLKVSKYFYITEGIIILTIVIVILFAGAQNAKKFNIVNYEVNIKKEAKGLKKLHAVLLSDIHIGNSIKLTELYNIIDAVNKLEPDIVFIAGDILNDEIRPLFDERVQQGFRTINAKYGVYGVFGNHDIASVKNNTYLYASRTEKGTKNIIYCFENSGIKIMRDDYIKIKDSFYVIGRDDISIKSYNGEKRKSLTEIAGGIDKNLPIILLDHRPIDLSEAYEVGVDLQLSGHTHGGQIFPECLTNKLKYGINKGYLKKGEFNLIVSSGIGTWGAPVRIGSKGEIVSVTINFTDENKKAEVFK